jgi:hypothetical protein
MNVEDLEAAAEFCKHVGAPNLLVYLGLDERVDAAEVRGKLKSRRKFMQGMQGNPKYKREALLLIKHFQNLNDAVADVTEYLADARRRSESEHLPIIEMTVRGVLAGGGLTPDQEDYLRRNALELGVSEQTFRELLVRLAKELSIPVKSAKDPTPAPPPDREPQVDLYTLLGISPNATEDDVRLAYQVRMAEIEKLGDTEKAQKLRKRTEIAQKVLSNEAARRHYDLTASRTGPPSRQREYGPTPAGADPVQAAADDRGGPPRGERPARIDQAAATAPPVRERWMDPTSLPPTKLAGNPRLEILGEPVRPLRVGFSMTVASITVRNGGDGEMGGAVVADVPWVAIDPKRLDPQAREQTVSIQIDPQDLPSNAASAVVTIQTDRGERARVVFEITRGPPRSLIITFLVVIALLLAAVLGFLLMP